MTQNESVVHVPLTNSDQVAIVDASEAWVLERNWCLLKRGTYASVMQSCDTGGENGRYLHRLILNVPRGQEVDHINGSTLDNRRANLRLATRQENNRNRFRAWGSSRFKGVSWQKRNQRWQAYIGIDKRTRHLGLFDNEADAARAYDAAALELFGEYVRTNESLGLFDLQKEVAA